MKYTSQKLIELQQELEVIIKDVKAGKINEKVAADKIIHIREEMDIIITHLKSVSKKI
jgi:hypothetical protein